MLFQSSEPVPRKDLEAKLLTMARDRGDDFVYTVDTLGPEMTPRLLYRMSPDGKRELVRGAVLDDIDDRALRSSDRSLCWPRDARRA